MKNEGYHGENRALAPIDRGKRYDPMADGTQAVFKAQVREDKLLGFVDQRHELDQSKDNASEEEDESQPGQWPGHQRVNRVHVNLPYRPVIESTGTTRRL